MRRLGKAAVVVLALLSLLVLLLGLPPGERLIKGIAEGKLQDLFGQEVRIGSLETNLFSRLQLRDLRVYQEQAGDTMTLLDLGYARIRFRLLDLLRNRLTIDSLSIDDLFLSLVRDSSGSINIPVLAPSAPEEGDTAQPSLRIQLGKAALNRATIRYIDQSVPMAAALQNLSVTAERQEGERYLYRAEVDSIQATYDTIPLTGGELKATGSWDAQELLLDSISVHLPGLEFAGNARMLQNGESPSLAGDFSLKGNPGKLAQIAREHFMQTLPPIQGDMNLAIKLSGSLDRPKLSVRLDLAALDIAEIPVRTGFIQAEWEPDLITLDQMSLHIFGGEISGIATLATNTLFAYEASVWLQGIDFAQVWRSIYGEASPYRGKIGGVLRASGQTQDPKNWDVSSDLKLTQVSYGSKSLPDFSTSLTFKDGLARLSLRQGDSKISSTVKLKEKELEGEFSAKIVQLGPLAGLLDIRELSGGMEINGTLRGTIDSPEISAEVNGEKIAYQDFPVDSLILSALYRDKKLHISSFDFAGSLDPIDTLRPPFHLSGLAGKIRYAGHASGPVDSLQGQVLINLAQPSYWGINFNEGLIRAVLENRRIEMSSLRFRRDSLLIDGTGQFYMSSAKGTCEIQLFKVPTTGQDVGKDLPEFPGLLADSLGEVRLAGGLTASFDLSDPNLISINVGGSQLEMEQVRSLFPHPPDIGGSMQFNLDFSGNLDNPNAKLDFHYHKPRFQSAEMDSVTGHLTFADGNFRFEPLELYYASHYAWAAGSVQLEKRDDGSFFVSDQSLLQGQAQGQDLDIGFLQPFLAEDMQISGSASYDLSWNGTLSHPRPVGTLSLRDGTVQTGENVPPIERIDMSCSVQDSILSLDSLSGVVRETPFRLQGNVTTRAPEEFAVRLNLSVSDFGTMTGEGFMSSDSVEFAALINKMDLATLQPFLSDIKDLSGILDAELSAKGQTADPQIDGDVEIRELAFQPAGFDSPLNQGLVRIDFNRDQVKVDSLLLRKQEGVIFVTGILTHDKGELSKIDLDVSVDDVKITRPEELILVVKSARLGYKSQNSYHLLDGDIILGESRMLVNFKPQSILPFAKAVEAPTQELPSLLQQTRMNIRLRESENIWVDNNLARLRMHTELGVIGSPAQPNLTGRVVVEEGYILYLDRKFKIKQGVVDFIDPDRLNPIIDFRAQTTVTSYQATEATPYLITLAISGPLDEVVVELVSDPPEDKSNILSLLTIGATREQLGGKDAEGKDASLSAVLKERARSISSQKVAGYTSRKVGGLLGLEQFTIEGDLFRFDQSWGPQLLASKKISPRMEITYITTVGHSNENSFRLDYRLSKHFSLEGQTDQQGRAGMNLKYRLRSKR